MSLSLCRTLSSSLLVVRSREIKVHIVGGNLLFNEVQRCTPCRLRLNYITEGMRAMSAMRESYAFHPSLALQWSDGACARTRGKCDARNSGINSVRQCADSVTAERIRWSWPSIAAARLLARYHAHMRAMLCMQTSRRFSAALSRCVRLCGLRATTAMVCGRVCKRTHLCMCACARAAERVLTFQRWVCDGSPCCHISMLFFFAPTLSLRWPARDSGQASTERRAPHSRQQCLV